MRSAILSYIGFTIIFIQLLILSTLISHSTYKSSIEDSLEDSMTYAVARLQVGYTENVESSLATNNQQERTGINWSSTSPDKFTNEFLNFFTESIDSRVTDLKVNVFGVDEENGLLSVEVIANFNYIDGKQGTVSCYKTIILNTILK